MQETAVAEFKLHVMMHVAEILTRDDFCEVYTTLDTSNLQSTFKLYNILRMPHTVLMFDCSRFTPTNGVNFSGSPEKFLLTPKETWQAKFWRLSQDRDYHCIDHARKQNLLELMSLMGDSLVGKNPFTRTDASRPLSTLWLGH